MHKYITFRGDYPDDVRKKVRDWANNQKPPIIIVSITEIDDGDVHSVTVWYIEGVKF